MKRFITFLLAGFSAIAQPVKHAVLNESLDAVVGYQMIDPALVAQYAADPAKAPKVARLRVVVETAAPASTIQQTVDDLGYTITATNVYRTWNVRSLTPQEIADRNSGAIESIGQELDRRIRGTNWAGLSRVTSLQSEMIGKEIQLQLLNCELLLLITKAVGQSALTNNLTAGERARVLSLRNQLSFPQQTDWTAEDTTRVVAIRDELIKAYQLWLAGKNARTLIASTNVVVEPSDASLWPSLEIGE